MPLDVVRVQRRKEAREMHSTSVMSWFFTNPRGLYCYREDDARSLVLIAGEREWFGD